MINLLKGHPITAASFIENQGIVAGHGYIIQGHIEMQTPSGAIRLLKVKNPFKKDTST